MPAVFKTIINMSAGETLPIVAVAACGAGSFAFILTCIAAWLRKKVE
jgi:hypothetical protein